MAKPALSLLQQELDPKNVHGWRVWRVIRLLTAYDSQVDVFYKFVRSVYRKQHVCNLLDYLHLILKGVMTSMLTKHVGIL